MHNSQPYLRVAHHFCMPLTGISIYPRWIPGKQTLRMTMLSVCNQVYFFSNTLHNLGHNLKKPISLRCPMKFFVITLAVLTFVFPLNLMARSLTNNKADYLHLPRFCRYTQWREPGVSVTELKKWQHKLGGDWIHVHHFCLGLNNNVYALKTLNKKKHIWLSKLALTEFTYILNHASKNFVLMPVTNVKIGEILVRLNKHTEAEKMFYKAIKLNPKFTPSYSELSKLYIKQKKKTKAKEILLEGLKKSPNSNILKFNLDKIK